MKIKVAKKEIMENYKNVICVGYCDLCYLLKCIEPRFFTNGVYGWNSDIYEINENTCICTGYRPFGNISANGRNIIKKYDNKAKAIWYNYDLTYDQQKKKVSKLLDKFILEVLQ